MEVLGGIFPPRRRPASAILYANQSTALGCEHACSRPASGSQEQDGIGIKLVEGGKRAGRGCHPQGSERQAGEAPWPLQSNFHPVKRC